MTPAEQQQLAVLKAIDARLDYALKRESGADSPATYDSDEARAQFRRDIVELRDEVRSRIKQDEARAR